MDLAPPPTPVAGRGGGRAGAPLGDAGRRGRGGRWGRGEAGLAVHGGSPRGRREPRPSRRFRKKSGIHLFAVAVGELADHGVAKHIMFRIYRNTMLSETAHLQRGVARLREVLPTGWRVEDVGSPGNVDRLLRLIAPDGAVGVLAVEAKRRLAPGAIPSVRAALAKQTSGTPVVVAGWLSRLTQHALREAGIGYLDLTGNLEIRLDRPGLYLRDVGAPRDPEPAPSALKSLKGAGAARAVRALVDFAPPYGVRELSAASGASAALVSRVVGLLEKEALVVRDEVITYVDWEKVLTRWAEDYSFTKANRVVTAIDPRGAAAFVRRLASYHTEWAATGALGTPPGVRVVPLQVVSIYVRSPEDTMNELGLTPTTAGANVLLVAPPDDGPLTRVERSADGVVRCAPSQVVADILTGPGRGASEAHPVLEWMKRNESAWRRRP